MRFLGQAAALGVIVSVLGGCQMAHRTTALIQSKAGFVQCTPDPRLQCEPGSEALAARIAPLLAPAIVQVEQAQHGAFPAPIVIYTYASRDSFGRHSGVDPDARGAVLAGAVHLSPRLLTEAARRQAILAHELAHLHLVMYTGALAAARLPNWFFEGLPTWVSGGGGAEDALPENARYTLRHGRHFEPEESGSILFPSNASTYQLSGHMYYRQASLFVAFLHDTDPGAFDQLLVRVKARERFGAAIQAAYDKPLPVLWQDFLRSLPN
jgi:hypothetical protein